MISDFRFNKKSRTHTSGFTLIETLVAISVFSIMIVVITGVFLNANNLQKNTASFQRLQNNGRYIIEKIAKEIRAREVDFPATFGSNPLSALYFKPDEYGVSTNIVFDPSADRGGQTVASIVYSNDFGSDFLNSQDVEITDIKFLVYPTADEPWGTEPVSNLQHRVTILLKTRNTNVADKYKKELTFQTTISSKVYKR